MKQRLICLIMLFAVHVHILANTENDFFNSIDLVPRWTAEDEALVKDRLQLMISPVELKFDDEVKERVKSYTTYGYKGTETMLGRSALYFPIFEEMLRRHNLPQQLKYLPIIESKLKPSASSKAGAIGLWQLMPATAKSLGLRTSQEVDERRDPHKSTEAAVLYLKKLHREFNDWNLAIVAYNCGAGNVRKAIRQAASVQFLAVKRYLPKETQAYLSRFIAASYIAENYHFHNLRPRFPEHNLTMTSAIKLYSYISFDKIASLSGTTVEDIRLLNPAYRKERIPASQNGNYLILPDIGMTRLQNHLKYSNVRTNIADLNRASGGGRVLHKVTYEVQKGDTLGALARTFKCKISEIKAWNNMATDRIYQNQELTFYVL